MERRRAHGFVLALAFFAGVVLSIAGLGVAASYIGRLLADWSIGFAITTAVVSLFAGAAAVFAPLIRRRFRSPEIEKRGGAWGVRFSTASRTHWPP